MNHELLVAALEGLEAQKERLEEKIQEVRAALGRKKPGRPAKNGDAPPPVKAAAGGKISEAGRRRIAAAQKRRWAEFRKGQGSEAQQ